VEGPTLGFEKVGGMGGGVSKNGGPNTKTAGQASA
jgi:hypothetical protein